MFLNHGTVTTLHQVQLNNTSCSNSDWNNIYSRIERNNLECPSKYVARFPQKKKKIKVCRYFFYLIEVSNCNNVASNQWENRLYNRLCYNIENLVKTATCLIFHKKERKKTCLIESVREGYEYGPNGLIT